jgi:hypothetical protein
MSPVASAASECGIMMVFRPRVCPVRQCLETDVARGPDGDVLSVPSEI